MSKSRRKIVMHNTRNLTRILLLIFFCLISAPAFAGSWNGWIYQNPYPSLHGLEDIKFVSPDKGWAVGKYGTILYTEDGGNTWDLQASGMPDVSFDRTNDLNSIFFLNGKTGWIVGEKGNILSTENGGKNWERQELGSEYNFKKVLFVDSKEGWILAEDTNRKHVLFCTKDGGKSWSRESFNLGKIGAIFFKDSKTGWILGEGKVFKTIDGGKKWQPNLLPIDSKTLVRFSGDIYFANDKVGWVLINTEISTSTTSQAETSQIFHTTDGGKTWKFQLSGGIKSSKTIEDSRSMTTSFEGSAFFFNSLIFANEKRGCVLGNTIFCTDDGGTTWEEKLGAKPGERKTINGFPLFFWAGDFVNNDEAWVISGRLIMKTEDGGKNWSVKTRGAGDIGYIKFINATTGLAVRSDKYREREIGASGAIIKTSDGGDHWEIQKKFTNPIKIYGSYFINPLTGWMVGTGGEVVGNSVILYTNDGGKTWEVQYNKNLNFELLDVYFADANSGWVVGENGIILHTKDGGKAWTLQKSGTKLDLNNIHFVDSKRGWAAGRGNISDFITQAIVLYTEDGGEHWQTQWKAKNELLQGMFFLNDDKGWITLISKLFYTEDGGKHWVEKKLPAEILDLIGEDDYLGSLYFVDDNRGCIQLNKLVPGEYIQILFITVDGGNTWKKLEPSLHKYPWKVFNDK